MLSLLPTFLWISTMFAKQPGQEDATFYFGTNGQELSGRELAEAYPDGTCNTRHFSCIHNPTHKIATLNTTTPYDCCKSCLANTKCASFSFWYADLPANTQYVIGDNPMCNLFDVNLNHESSNISAGNCVIGENAQSEKRPNFIVMYPDTLRASMMSIYGYPLKTTPNIDAFVANEGIAFDTHTAQNPFCSPSRTCMLAGRYVHNNAYRTLTSLIQPWQPSYLRWLKDSGYYVLWLGKNDALAQQTFPLTVNEWLNYIGVDAGSNMFTYPNAGYYSFLYTGSNVAPNDTRNGDYKAVNYAINFMKSNNYKPPQPFIIFLPGMGAHPPYGSPMEYHKMWNPKDIEKYAPLRPPYGDGKPQYFDKTGGIPWWHNLEGFNDSFFYEIAAAYAGKISYMDYNFGVLWNGTKQFDAETKTETGLILTSDHGDYSGDYRMVEKWPAGLDDVMINIPLIGKLPGSKVKNIHIKAPTESFDIFETILEVANINRTFVTFAHSLMDQFMNGYEGDLSRNVYSEGGFHYRNVLFPCGSDHICDPKNIYYPKNAEQVMNNGTGCPRSVMIRNLNYKIVYRKKPFISEFYDVINDPIEKNNLWDTTDANLLMIKSELLMNLTSWYLETADLVPILTDPRGFPPPSPATSSGPKKDL
eukprot:31102_1